MRYYFEAFRKYAVFSGRATRSEFWYFILVNGVITLLLTVIAGTPGRTGAILEMFRNSAYATAHAPVQAYFLFSFLPQIALSVRRFHDTGRSGWWILLVFAADVVSGFPVGSSFGFLWIPFALITLFLIVVWAQDSQPGPNRYGPNPKGVNPAALNAVATLE